MTNQSVKAKTEAKALKKAIDEMTQVKNGLPKSLQKSFGLKLNSLIDEAKETLNTLLDMKDESATKFTPVEVIERLEEVTGLTGWTYMDSSNEEDKRNHLEAIEHKDLNIVANEEIQAWTFSRETRNKSDYGYLLLCIGCGYITGLFGTEAVTLGFGPIKATNESLMKEIEDSFV